MRAHCPDGLQGVYQMAGIETLSLTGIFADAAALEFCPRWMYACQ